MKANFWGTAIGCALISLILFWGVLEGIFHDLPPSRVQTLGYKVAVILAFMGIAGIAIGMKILKKRPVIAAVLIGFFAVPVGIAMLTFIVGP